MSTVTARVFVPAFKLDLPSLVELTEDWAEGWVWPCWIWDNTKCINGLTVENWRSCFA
jgi:hypothetical protein